MTFLTPLHGATYTVDSAADVAALMTGVGAPQAVSGDEIVWENGVYDSESVTLAGVDGITLRAETPGQVVFTGSSFINIGSDDSTVSGFEIQIPDDIDPALPDDFYNKSNVFQFRAGDNDDHAHNSRISNCRIRDLRTGASYLGGHSWVVFYGRGNTVDNCNFEGKRSERSLIIIYFYTETGGSDRGGEHSILNNHFVDRPIANPADDDGNEWEIIRIGDSSAVCIDAGILVADNLFEQCDGEIEVVSNKNSANLFLNNTFRDCDGQLTIRQGSDCLIEGNYFIGTGSTKEGGIRVTGEDHVIVNNYFEDLQGTGHRSAISVMAGQLDWDPGNDCISVGGYRPVDDVLIAHNTMVDCKRPFEFGSGSNSTRDQAPDNVTLANNAVHSSSSHSLLTYTMAASGVSYSGNVFYHTSGVGELFSGATPSYTSADILFDDPELSPDATLGFYRPSGSSPVLNAAVVNYAEAGQDILGNGRPSTGRDVGAEEVSGATVTGANLRPLVATDVGCTWGDTPGPGPVVSQTVTINPVDDAYVRGGIHADTTFGATDSQSLKVELSTSSDYDKRAFLKFDLSGVTGTVTSATVRLKIESMNTGVKNNLRPVTDDSWGEWSITWNNKPGYGSSFGTYTLPGADQWIEWDVTDFINAEASGDGVASFCVLPHSSTVYLDAAYYSAECGSGDRPELVVTYE